MMNPMDNVGRNRTRGDLLHVATIVKRTGFRKCPVGAVRSMGCRFVPAALAWGRQWPGATVNRFPTVTLSHCVGNRFRTQSSRVWKKGSPSAVIYF